jgi:hypothetical protein
LRIGDDIPDPRGLVRRRGDDALSVGAQRRADERSIDPSPWSDWSIRLPLAVSQSSGERLKRSSTSIRWASKTGKLVRLRRVQAGRLLKNPRVVRYDPLESGHRSL